MKYSIKLVCLLVCVAAFSSCVTIAHDQNLYKNDISGQIGCLPEDIQVTPAPNRPEEGYPGIADIMYAECKGVKYICSGPLSGQSCAVAK